MSEIYDLVIIGAGPAGLTAAIYAGRASLSTLVIDPDEPGGQIRITSSVANYPGILHTDGKSISDKMKEQAIGFGADILKANVNFIDFDLPVKKIYPSVGNVIETLGVIVATGAKPRRAGFDGEEEFYGHGVGYCATCDGEFFKDLDVFVVGAGISAAEEAIYLTRYAKKVIIIAREAEFSCPKSIVDSVMQNEKIEVHFETEVLAIGGENLLKYARFINNRTKEEWEYRVSDPASTFGVFVFIGYMPMSSVFKDYLQLGEGGYIQADEQLMTNVEGVFVAGDIRPKPLRQLVTAVSDGAIASVNAEKYIDRIKKDLGITTQRQTTAVAQNNNLLDDSTSSHMPTILKNLESRVSVVAILDKGGNEDMRQLSQDIASFLSDFSAINDYLTVHLFEKGENSQLETAIGSWAYPVIAIMDKLGDFSGIRYYGVPEGHELSSFALGIYDVSGPGQLVEPQLLERIKKIAKPIQIQVCVLLTCTLCPDMVAACQLVASKNPNISCEMIDISKFPKLREKHSIMGVPFVIINEQTNFLGKKSLEELVVELEKI